MPNSPTAAEVIPLSFITLTRAEVKAEVLGICRNPEQRRMAEHLLGALEERGPGESRKNLRLTLLIVQAVAMLGEGGTPSS